MDIYLPVHIVTGEVDYGYIPYAHESIPTNVAAALIDDWEYRKFKVVGNQFILDRLMEPHENKEINWIVLVLGFTLTVVNLYIASNGCT